MIDNLVPGAYSFTLITEAADNFVGESTTIDARICALDFYATSDCDTQDNMVINDSDLDMDTILNVNDLDVDGNLIGDRWETCSNLENAVSDQVDGGISLISMFVPNAQGGNLVLIGTHDTLSVLSFNSVLFSQEQTTALQASNDVVDGHGAIFENQSMGSQIKVQVTISYSVYLTYLKSASDNSDNSEFSIVVRDSTGGLPRIATVTINFCPTDDG